MDGQPMDMEVIDVGDRKQLLLDDLFIHERDGIALCVNIPEKTGDRLIVADQPWENRFVGPYCTVLDDEGLYRMWYESYYADDTGNRHGVLCYAESNDAAHWTKPRLGVHDFSGSTANNIVFPPPGVGYHGGTVFKDPTAVPAERYKLFYFDAPAGIRAAHSPDGFRWAVYPGEPLLYNQSDSQNVCFWDDRLQKYVAYVRLNRPVRDPERTRTVGRSETADFLSWPAADTVLSFDQEDPPDVDLYNSAAIKYPHADNAYFILTSCFSHSTDTLEPRLATSRDGIRWQRPSRRAFIPLGEEGSFDSKMIHTCVGQFARGTDWWTFYRGTNGLHSTHGGKSQLTYNGAISRVRSRVDGFVSVDAADEGSFTTPLLRACGSGLRLNCVTRAGGYVKAELLDAAGKPIPSCGLENCVPVTGDHLNAAVTWGGAPGIAEHLSKAVRLRLHLCRAKVFAFQFVNE